MLFYAKHECFSNLVYRKPNMFYHIFSEIVVFPYLSFIRFGLQTIQMSVQLIGLVQTQRDSCVPNYKHGFFNTSNCSAHILLDKT